MEKSYFCSQLLTIKNDFLRESKAKKIMIQSKTVLNILIKMASTGEKMLCLVIFKRTDRIVLQFINLGVKNKFFVKSEQVICLNDTLK